jgi:hypothetical protein
MIIKIKLEKLNDKYWLRYLILWHETFTWLCLMTLFTKFNFLFNQMIIEI